MAEETLRSRPRRKILLIAFAVLMLIVIVVVVFYYLSTLRLRQQLADLRSRGLPTNASELNAYYSTVPPDVPDATAEWTAALNATRIAYTGSNVKNIPIVGFGPTPIPSPGEEWAELEASRSHLKELDHEIQLIMRAANVGGVARYPLDFTAGYGTLLPAHQETRSIARLMSLSGHVHAHDGKSQETLRDVSAIFVLSESLRGDPLVILQLLRIANHAIGCQLVADMLPHCQWNDTELQNLQITIGRADFRSDMLGAMHGERAMFLDASDRFPYPQSLFRKANKLKAIELFKELTEGLETSWTEAIKRHQKVDAELKGMAANTVSGLTYMSMIQILPGIYQAVNSGTKAEARQNCCIATIAAYRFRLKHGTLPKTLTDLKDFIPDADPSKSSRLIDPFDEQPLRLTNKGDGVVIYSVGENRADDGGDVENEKPEVGDLGYLISE